MSDAPPILEVDLYTDGACSGNPGPGGYGAVLLCKGSRKELSGGFRKTTNNRMEIMGAIEGLRQLRFPCKVTVYTDSKYLHDSIEKGWAKRWKANRWKRNKEGDEASNADLWNLLLELCAKHQIIFTWVKGHASNAENNRCDELAVAATKAKDLPMDNCYEVFYS